MLELSDCEVSEVFLSELLVIVEVYVLVSVVLSTLKEELHPLIGRTTSNNVERMDRKYHNFFLKCIKIPPCIVMYSRNLFVLDFVADFPPTAPEFHQRTHRVRLKNLDITDKKSSHKIKRKKIPRVHCVILNLYSF